MSYQNHVYYPYLNMLDIGLFNRIQSFELKYIPNKMSERSDAVKLNFNCFHCETQQKFNYTPEGHRSTLINIGDSSYKLQHMMKNNISDENIFYYNVICDNRHFRQCLTLTFVILLSLKRSE